MIVTEDGMANRAPRGGAGRKVAVTRETGTADSGVQTSRMRVGVGSGPTETFAAAARAA